MSKKAKTPNGCQCEFCVTHDKYRWATITECQCACHKADYPIGHEGLCCEFPNGKIKDNPYKELKPAKEYKQILNKLEADSYEEL